MEVMAVDIGSAAGLQGYGMSEEGDPVMNDTDLQVSIFFFSSVQVAVLMKE
jgi:hypothetical protein